MVESHKKEPTLPAIIQFGPLFCAQIFLFM